MSQEIRRRSLQLEPEKMYYTISGQALGEKCEEKAENVGSERGEHADAALSRIPRYVKNAKSSGLPSVLIDH